MKFYNNKNSEKYSFALYVAFLLLLTKIGFSQEPVPLTPLNMPSTYIQVVSADDVTHNNSLEYKIKIHENSFVVPSDALSQINGILYKSDFFQKGNDTIFILPRIVYKTAYSNVNMENISEYYNISIEDKGNNKYVMSCDVANSQDIVSIIALLSETDGVIWCEPEYYLNLKRSNTLYNQQYYLNNTGQNNGTAGIDINVEPAWSISTGENIVVAVIDDGVESNHEDMQNTVLQGYTAGVTNGNGTPINANSLYTKYHGTACAGIIAANDNSIGIKGIASEAKVLPVNVYPYTPEENIIYDHNMTIVARWVNTGCATNIETAEAITWASNRADIISCSWEQSFYDQDVADAIMNARMYGREGKGCVVVCSSGNSLTNNNELSFPASINDVVSVGAIDNNGVIWNYSRRGNGLKLVAPSGNIGVGDIATTDLMGVQGCSSGNYTNTFGGTSAACPQVAGVAALVLSANPNLTATQVENILYSTARDMGAQGYDNTYGYGLVDAYAAVKAARNYDLYTRDNLSDNGSEPLYDPLEGLTDSPDLWLRHYQDGGTTHQQMVNGTNYLYATIHSQSTSADTSWATDTIRVFAKPTFLNWHHWSSGSWSELCAAPLPRIAPGTDTTICIPVSNQGLFALNTNYALYSRIESHFDQLSAPETSSVGRNVEDNNNISLKNVYITNNDILPNNYGFGIDLNTAPYLSTVTNSKLKIKFTNGTANILDYAEVTLIFPEDLMTDWSPISDNLKQVTANTFLVTGETVEISGVPETDVTLRYNFLTRRNEPEEIYKNHITQYVGEDEELVGGLLSK